MHKYRIIIYWSDEDDAFVAEVPELPGCAARGDTQEAATREVNQAVDSWIEAARESGAPVPEPPTYRIHRRAPHGGVSSRLPYEKRKGHTAEKLDKSYLGGLEEIEYVTAIFGPDGPFKKLRENRELHEKIKNRFWDEREELTKKHPRKWIAVGEDVVHVLADSREEVLVEFREQGHGDSAVVLEYLDPNPPIMLL